MTRDFTLDKYRLLCQAIRESAMPVITIHEHLLDPHQTERLLILRHDVDRCPRNALHMAELESEFELHSTYYFRFNPQVFKPEIIHQIADLGHEIGYHYETLSKARGNLSQALKLFERELAEFRKITQVHTICMHGSPLSPFDNRDLWKEYDFRQFNLTGEAFLSIDYRQIQYFTDTGRTWQRTQFNIRDFSPESQPADWVRSTDDLIAAVLQKTFSRMCITAHPERWAPTLPNWFFSLVFDQAANYAKAGLQWFKSASSK